MSAKRSYRRVNYTEIEPVSGGMHFLREPLESDRIGVTIARCEPNWRSQPHDHAENDHEEVYLLIEGRATVNVDGDPVEMESGDAIWIDPEAERQIENGSDESIFVLASAPECPIPSEKTSDSEWILEGVQG